jgi:predicted neuraminidase
VGRAADLRRRRQDLVGAAPVKNKPIELADGTLLCGTSSEDNGWQLHIQSTRDYENWKSVGPLNDGRTIGAIQPSFLVHPGGKLQILCRSRQGVLVESWSDDNGKTWSAVTKTALPNPNSGTDAVTLKDGRHLLVYNPTKTGRTPLAVAVSSEGKTWKDVLTLEKEPGEYSYPAVIQAADGRVHITYTWKRQRVKHVALDPTRLK